MSSPSTVESSSDADNRMDEERNHQRNSMGTVLDDKGILNDDHDGHPSETESITTEYSYGPDGGSSGSNDSDVWKIKVEFLNGQLQDRERIIQQLQDEKCRAREEFEVLERESAECMEELSSDVQELQEQLQQKDCTIRELESLQMIPEGDDDAHEHMEQLKQQLESRNKCIQELELSLRNNDTKNNIFMAEINKLKAKLKHKEAMLEKVEESESINFALIEDRDEEIARLNEKIRQLETAAANSEKGTSTSTDEEMKAEFDQLRRENIAYSRDLQATTEELMELTEKNLEQNTDIERLNSLVEANNKDAAELDLKLQEQMQENKRLKEGVLNLKQDMVGHVLETERLKESLKVSQQNSSKQKEQWSQLMTEHTTALQESKYKEKQTRAEMEALKVAFEEQEAECKMLRRNVEILAMEKQPNEQFTGQSSKLQELYELLAIEEETCESLKDKLEILSLEQSKRDRSIHRLGFNSEDELIEKFCESQKALQQKEVEIEEMSKLKNAAVHETFSTTTDSYYFGELSEGKTFDNSTGNSKSLENLLVQKHEVRCQLDEKLKALAAAMRKWDNGQADAKNLVVNDQTFHYRLLSQIEEIVISLKTSDQVNDDLITAFQLELQPLTSLQTTLEAREAQIELLIQELEESEKQNMGASCNSSSSSGSQSLVLSGKLERLLDDINQRDEKLRVLEWLTMDLSKTLESKTDQLQALREASAVEISNLEKRVDLLLNDIQHREVEIQGLKKLIEEDEKNIRNSAALEAALNVEMSQKEKLQAQVDALTRRLDEAEVRLESLESDLKSKDAVIELREAQVEKSSGLQESLEAEQSKYKKLESNIDSFKASLLEKNESTLNEKAKLETQVFTLEKELEEKKQEIDALACTLASKEAIYAGLEEDRQAKIEECKDLEHEVASIINEISVKEQQIAEFVSKHASQEELLKEKTAEVLGLEKQIAILRAENTELEKEHLAQADKLLAAEQLAHQSEQLSTTNEEILATLEESRIKLRKTSEELERIRVVEEQHLESQANLEKQIEELTASLDESKAALHHGSENLAKLQDKETENNVIKSELIRLTEELRMTKLLLNQVEEAKQHDTKSFEEAAQLAKEKSQHLEDQNSRLQSELNSLENCLEQQLKELRNENATLLDTMKTKDEKLEESSSFAAQLAELHKTNTDLMADLKSKNEQLKKSSSLATQLEELKKTNSGLVKNNDEQLKECSSLASLLEEFKKINAALLDDIKVKNEQLKESLSVAGQLQELKALHANFLTERQGLEAHVNDLERQLAEKTEVFQEMTVIQQLVEDQKIGQEDLLAKIDNLTLALSKKEVRIAKLLQEKVKLKSLINMTDDDDDLTTQLEEQQKRFAETSAKLQSIFNVLEDREAQMKTIEEEIKLKDEFIKELQQKIDEYSGNMDSLMDEHECDCAEFQRTIASLGTELLDQRQQEPTTARLLEQNLQEIQSENKRLKSENDKFAKHLKAIGFATMDELVQSLAIKIQEHKNMEKLIVQHEKQIHILSEDRQRSMPTSRDDQGECQGNAGHIHKIRELEMKVEIFREEIAGKNQIIEDLTLRLNGDTNERSLACRSNKVSFVETDGQTHSAQSDMSAADTSDKALSAVPDFMQLLKQKDSTIELLEKEIASNKRAIDALARGLEFNVQEKIEADKIIHESKTQYESRVRHLSKQLARRERILDKLSQQLPRPMKRNLATIDEIKSLSVDELVDLLAQSRVLSEDLEQERERLIDNANNLSIALAESRQKVDELTKKQTELQQSNAAIKGSDEVPGRVTVKNTIDEIPSRVTVTGLHRVAQKPLTERKLELSPEAPRQQKASNMKAAPRKKRVVT